MSICFGKYYSMLGVFRLFGCLVFLFLVFKGGCCNVWCLGWCFDVGGVFSGWFFVSILVGIFVRVVFWLVKGRFGV